MSTNLDGREFDADEFGSQDNPLGHTKNQDSMTGSLSGEIYPAEPLFPNRVFRAMVNHLTYHVNIIQTAATNAAASTAADVLLTAADAITTNNNVTACQTAQAAAEAAATSLEFPAATTAGAEPDYTVNFTPDLTVTDGSAFRINIHSSNTGAPTLAVDGGAAKSLVGVPNRTIAAGEMTVGRNLVISYDSALDKYVVLAGLPLVDLTGDLDAKGHAIKNRRRFDVPVTYRDTVYAHADRYVIRFREAVRLFQVAHSLGAGTVDFTLKKNGVAIGGLTSVSASTTQTTTAVDDSGNAYIDFAAGDILTIDITSPASAENLAMWLDAIWGYIA